MARKAFGILKWHLRRARQSSLDFLMMDLLLAPPSRMVTSTSGKYWVLNAGREKSLSMLR